MIPDSDLPNSEDDNPNCELRSIYLFLFPVISFGSVMIPKLWLVTSLQLPVLCIIQVRNLSAVTLNYLLPILPVSENRLPFSCGAELFIADFTC